MDVQTEPDQIGRFGLLSPRHKDCLRLTYRRRRTKEIAADLGLSPGTVSTYCTEAIRLLGARDRRDAAEQLHAWETGLARPVPEAPSPETSSPQPPSGVQPPSEGVASAPREPAASVPAVPSWQRLPLRQKDAGNDLPVLTRLLWVPVLAVLILIGFGACANGLHVISDIVRGLAGR